ncbi:chemotaxis-specific protein-glutamate methyltransferase CheB [Methylomonas sp. MgM2]
MIRVLLVDDSAIVLHILQSLLRRSADILVVGTAGDGKEALKAIPALDPDVICTDLHMPTMDGLELTRAVMASHPRPILVISVSVPPDSPNVFRLLEAGAIDVFLKPRDILTMNRDELAQSLASKIRVVAGVHVFRIKTDVSAGAQPGSGRLPALHAKVPVKIAVIGASTGGPQALHAILRALPRTFPIPLLCIQHIGTDFLTELVRWLAEVSPLPVRQAIHGEMPEGGVIYFAPGNSHSEFDEFGRFMLSEAPAYDGHRPSITVSMKAAAHRYGAASAGVLLTGMGNDGAAGLAEIAAAGGVTIAQDEASSVVYGMPQAAIALRAVAHQLPLDLISAALVALSKSDLTADTEQN